MWDDSRTSRNPQAGGKSVSCLSDGKSLMFFFFLFLSEMCRTIIGLIDVKSQNS